MMSNWEQNIELINNQIKGKLTPEQEQLFGARLRSEPDFAIEYQETQLVCKAIRANVLKRNFHHLQQFEKTLPEVSIDEGDEKKHRIGWRKWSVAAGFLLIVLAGSYLFLNNNLSPDEIFDNNFTAWSALNIDRDRGEGEDIDLKKRTYILYNTKQYDKAIVSFKKLIDKEKNPEDRLSLGMLYMTTNQMKEAIETMKPLKNADLQYQLPSKWYSALAHIKLGNKENARLLLENLKTYHLGNSYAKKAEDVLKDL